ncbi:MAG TPA: hypothetical protein VFO89_06035 [Thermoanaerobaculia bacterium]|nr:hypothetical protein [Thermoanaerobaculia bacterium]
MRKATFILTVLLALAAFPALAQFTNYHYNENMNCSDCHSMHASAHNNLTDGSAIETPNTTAGTAINPYYPNQPANGRHYLLKNDDVCATCHDGQTWAPDVIGANVNGYIRSAGGVKTSETTGGGHKIGSTVRPPGYNGAAVNNYFSSGPLECFSCHSPHGSATAFRNLGPYQMRSAIGMATASAVLPTVAKSATHDNTKDVTVNATSRTWGSDLPGYYGNDKVKYGRLATGSEITFAGVKASNRYDHFCGVCHGNFHGGEVGASPVADATGFIKHPTSIVQISSASTTVWGAQRGAQTLKVYTPDGLQGTDSSPGCVTCHKAHGNNNPFALIYPDRAAGTATTEEGIGIYKDLCKSCHSMGGS